MICFPNAKINIGLNIIRKRDDTYHDIESVMYPLTGIVYDALEVVRSEEFGVRSSGIKISGSENENLCVKAYNLLSKDFSIPPINIYLHKAIPMGAGLGGGSADAAGMIHLLNDTFNLGVGYGEMRHYAKQLGSDCSFFVANKPAFAEGKGDELEPVNLDLSNYHIAVIYSNIHINTATAYSEFDKAEGRRKKASPQKSSFGNGRLENLIQMPIEKWKNNIVNDFEEPVFAKHPLLSKIKEKLYSLGALYASMSGSGSAVYGIFNKEPTVNKKFSEYEVWEGKLKRDVRCEM